MNDFDLPLRRAYFNALKNQVEIEHNKIPIVDSKLEENKTQNEIYIMIANQNGQPEDTKCSFRSRVEITLDIVHRMRSAGQKRVVDLISDQILTVLFPDRRTNVLQIESPFKLYVPRLVSSNTTGIIQIQGSNDFMIVKTLVFSQIITQ